MTTGLEWHDSSQSPNVVFTSQDRADVLPYEDDPVVVSAIAMGRRVHRVLVDQGSSGDVMFWDAFTGFGILQEQLQYFDGVLIGFSGDLVEVRGYFDLRTMFADDYAAKTIVVRYIVVMAHSSYNILLG